MTVNNSAIAYYSIPDRDAREKKVMEAIQKSKVATAKEVCALTGMQIENVKCRISDLKAAGRIKIVDRVTDATTGRKVNRYAVIA